MRADLQRLKRDTDTSRSGVAPDLSQSDSSISAPSLRSQPLHRGPGSSGASDSQIVVGLAARHKKKLIATAAAALLARRRLGLLGYRWFGAHSGAQIDSLAVLPFANVTNDPNTGYLSEGLTESLISSLSQLPNLAVRSRSAVFRYKSQELDPQKAAAELKVDAVVTGRVTQQGDTLLVSAELTDARTNRNLWSEQYNRKVSDVLSVQREIAAEISARLREHLTGEQKAKVTKGGTSDDEAYQLYLKGRYFWQKRTPEALAKSKDYFMQAIAKDPNYADAYVGLADYWGVVGDYVPVPSSESIPQAKAAARKALELDNTLPAAHAALGQAHFLAWEWADWQKEFLRAIELDPNFANAHHWYGLQSTWIGREQEGVTHLKRAVELEPLNIKFNDNLGQGFMNARMDDQALEQYKKTIEMDPNFPATHGDLGTLYRFQGKYDLWLEEWKKLAQLNSDSADIAQAEAIASVYKQSGYKAAVQPRDRATQAKVRDSRYFDPGKIAEEYGYLGDKEQTFQWLEKAFAARSEEICIMRISRCYDFLRSDPRYKDLEKRAGLPD